MGRASRRKRDQKAAGGSAAGRPRPLPAALPRRSDVRSVASPATLKKLSESLLELIAPFREDGQPLPACQALVALGCLAWNLSLVPEEERIEKTEVAARELGSSEGSQLREVVGTLISRKQSLFPDDHRMIVSYEVTPTDSGFHLLVASARVAS